MKTAVKGWAARFLSLPPPLVVAGIYIATITMGASLMMLPMAQAMPMRWSDAFFMATSAVTVTGLAVVDVGSHLSLLGQAVLVTLVQLGGLGLMTFAVLILEIVGRPVGLMGEAYLREDLKQNALWRVGRLVRRIAVVVFAIEAVGIAILCLSFIPDLGFWPGLWAAIFHGIGAFNNAGFSIFRTGLMEYVADPIVNLVIPALFITGGIGYFVLHDLIYKRRWRYWSLNTRIMLAGTAVLIPWSVLMFAALEWTNPATLGGLDGIWPRIAASWFQGVTPRTAGFNTLDISGIHDSTAMLFISLMLIGGGATSTAGGIKVTTFVVMILATIAFFRRQTQLHIFGRGIGPDEVLKVMAIVAVSLVLVFCGVFLLSLSHDGHFLDIAFEVASAFSTTGLSRNYTPELNDFGRCVIMVIMFIGRLGPLTLGFFLATQLSPRVRYPQERIHIG
ncbi:TrkH family potassium uptake protein [Ketogulonicigenium vulgare]|uniref:K+ transporter Trk n=1 Tax=Ketogulonicigenium vulgare (strain WSH-001) TaxID=759362 RepID=F9YA74_KETVW|nr:potassium transporter TrkG [Ketogulonicigenium vulgare]ADO43191.1 K+ transporter Trk [Ketogulonicigenium vulgare Y25]AEM41485.1 K+ transporter Trk [Ketogulonicigenium vulgare WSH-001]ALJ81617.1 Ktr system potassium transporter B [Ketogulonicigenium vulgare]AOZ55227.1 K+ transporter Trk [Ketogulonicigenium vulgare]